MARSARRTGGSGRLRQDPQCDEHSRDGALAASGGDVEIRVDIDERVDRRAARCDARLVRTAIDGVGGVWGGIIASSLGLDSELWNCSIE